MADVESNKASTQARVTPSSANVGEKKCFVCKKQFGASDHVLRLPCNHKSCLTCMSEQEAEKLHANRPISCRKCKRHVSKIELSVNSRTLLKREEDWQSFFNFVTIAAWILLALFISIFKMLFSSSQHLWENIKTHHQSIWALTAENLTLVWNKMKQFTNHFFSSIWAGISFMGKEYRKAKRDIYRLLITTSTFSEFTFPKLWYNVLFEYGMGLIFICAIYNAKIFLDKSPKSYGQTDVLNYFLKRLVKELICYIPLRCIIIIGRAAANIVCIAFHANENKRLAFKKLFETVIQVVASLLALLFGILVILAFLVGAYYSVRSLL